VVPPIHGAGGYAERVPLQEGQLAHLNKDEAESIVPETCTNKRTIVQCDNSQLNTKR
jgi:hypothetical protein